MKKFNDVKLQNLGHMTAICLLAATVAACGGSSGGSAGGDGDGTDTQDLFGGSVDTDGDGLSDADEAIQGSDISITDTDSDGLDDLAEWNALTDPTKPDTDGDGTSDLDEINAGTNPTDASEGGNTTVVTTPPATDQCDDPTSSNDMWTDNCIVQRFGTYAQSSYAQGIQRILWCQSPTLQAASTIGAFSDGAFGPGTAEALRDYQGTNSLAVDGVVGPDTWNSLRSKLSLISFSSTIDGFDTYGISGCNDTTAQFYQQVRGTGTFDDSGAEIPELLGWKMAQTPGSTIRVDFSSGPAQ